MNEMYILIGLQITLLVIGMIYGVWNSNKTGKNEPLPLFIRILLSFSLTGAAIWMWVQNPGDPYRQWIAMGMTFSTLGDLFMAGLVPFGHRLIGGMMTFAIAHCFYVTAFLLTGISTIGLLIGVVLYGLVFIIAWFTFIRNSKQDKVFTIGSFIYGIWVGGMACFAFALAYAGKGTWWIPAIGGLLFVISDAIIGITEIGEKKVKYDPLLIWATYIAAQMCIIYVGI
ncbi:lysoplasmalogenase [Bacillus manliponensis]|uniref:lysoplasmalogenase n=1 Tax=Bacillus manliponensis TaxID=574376 RepID=UPI0035161CED